MPSEVDGLLWGRTRSNHWIPARFRSQTPDLTISGLVLPGSCLSLGKEFGAGRAEGGGNKGRDFTISMEKGMKNKPLLTNKELNKEKRS